VAAAACGRPRGSPGRVPRFATPGPGVQLGPARTRRGAQGAKPRLPPPVARAAADGASGTPAGAGHDRAPRRRTRGRDRNRRSRRGRAVRPHGRSPAIPRVRRRRDGAAAFQRGAPVDARRSPPADCRRAPRVGARCHVHLRRRAVCGVVGGERRRRLRARRSIDHAPRPPRRRGDADAWTPDAEGRVDGGRPLGAHDASGARGGARRRWRPASVSQLRPGRNRRTDSGHVRGTAPQATNTARLSAPLVWGVSAPGGPGGALRPAHLALDHVAADGDRPLRRDGPAGLAAWRRRSRRTRAVCRSVRSGCGASGASPRPPAGMGRIVGGDARPARVARRDHGRRVRGGHRHQARARRGGIRARALPARRIRPRAERRLDGPPAPAGGLGGELCPAGRLLARMHSPRRLLVRT